MRELLLPQRLAQAAGLSESAMMNGRLAGEDWTRLADGAGDLQRCLRPEQRQLLDDLVRWIWASKSEAQAPEPVPDAPARVEVQA